MPGRSHQGAVGGLPADASLKPATDAEARAFFEENFRPVRITKLGDPEGFLTGYYEPIVQGSRFPSPEFPVPLYRRPRDLEAPGHKPVAELSQQRQCRSAAATTRASSCRISTAGRSRPARSTASISKSAGCATGSRR